VSYKELDRAVAAIGSLPEGAVDEVALLFSSSDELHRFIAYAVDVADADYFNSVPRDTMRRMDHPSTFEVQFAFLRLPERPWRIEAMTVLEGDAPLHRSALNMMGEGCVVHLSYKCADLDRYQHEVRNLMNHEDRMMAEYRNSYGMFSYWQTQRRTPSLYPLLKPRVNLRDTEIVN
jgi:hypothetical protein